MTYPGTDGRTSQEFTNDNILCIISQNLFKEESLKNGESKHEFLDVVLYALFNSNLMKDYHNNMFIIDFMKKVEEENIRCIKLKDFRSHWFEKKHNFVQVLFPNEIRGIAKGYIVTDTMIDLVKNTNHTRRALEQVLYVMLSFYGYNRYSEESPAIKK